MAHSQNEEEAVESYDESQVDENLMRLVFQLHVNVCC